MSNEFQNNPRSENSQVKRYVHQPLTLDHYGIHATIKENGRVIITGLPDSNGDYDEVEIPASLIFKLSSALKMTRREVLVDISEIKKDS